MLKSFLFILFLVTTSDSIIKSYHWVNADSIEFGRTATDYKTESIYFYNAILNGEMKDNGNSKTDPFSFLEHAKPLDLFGYWGKEERDYHVLFTKTAYSLDKEAAYFTPELLSDVKYIKKTMPIAEISKNDSSYHLSMGFGVPDIDYTLQFYSERQLKNKWPELESYFEKYDGVNTDPTLVVLQHNYQYGKVMFQKTSKMSISITRYFQKSTKETLVLNYTLNYIHNMPPALIGGEEFLLKKIKEGIEALVMETEKVCCTSDN